MITQKHSDSRIGASLSDASAVRALGLGAALISLILLLPSSQALAGTTVQPAPVTAFGAIPSGTAASSWDVTLGVGAAYVPDYEGSDDYKVRPLPDLSVSYRDLVFLRGTMIGANAITVSGRGPGDKLQLGPLARWRQGRDESKNSALHGLGDVNDSIEVGGFARYSLGHLAVDLSVMQDVAGGHKGALVETGIGYGTQLAPKLKGNLRASTTWASDKYMQSYFGISPLQAIRSGRQTYDAGAGFKDAGLSLGLDYSLTDHWGLGARLGYTRLLGDAADTPIVKQDGSADQFMSAVAVRYHF